MASGEYWLSWWRVHWMHIALAFLTLYLPCFAATLKSDKMVTLHRHVPHWATRSSFVRYAEATESLTLLLDNGFSKAASLSAAQLASKISDPRNSKYRHYLTLAQYIRIYAAPATYVKETENWLRGQGFEVLHVPLNRKYIEFRGTVSQVEGAFGTRLAYFHVRVETTMKSLRAPISAPSIPHFFTQGVHRVAIIGLEEKAMRSGRGPVKVQPDLSSAQLAKRARHSRGLKYDVPMPKAPGCVWEDAKSPDPPIQSSPTGCNYSPAQLRSVYGIPSGATGKNQTIALLLWNYNPFVQADLDAFSGLHDIPSTTITQIFPPFNKTTLAGLLSNPPPLGFYDEGAGVEIALDTQIAHGIAPDAKLVYIYAASPNDADLLQAINAAIQFGIGSMLSNSWSGILYGPNGLIPSNTNNVSAISAVVETYNDLFIVGALLGYNILFSSGDGGDESFTPRTNFVQTPDFPAASPWVTAVGATFLAADANSKRLFEVPWGWKWCFEQQGYYFYDPSPGEVLKECLFYGAASGGGIAGNFYTPYFQHRSKDVRKVLQSTGFSFGRIVPDISMVGDPRTGLIIVYSTFENATNGLGTVTRSFAQYGGTSLSSPMFTGLLACLQQLTAAAGQPNFGFIAPTLYYLSSAAYYDVKPGNFSALFYDASLTHGLGDQYRVFGEIPNLPALTGYDNATGLGTPSSLFASLLSSVYKA
eukprot:TRINITY_DN8466_c0_g1_i2.p1 TRINITY_DN8466_c0_g1~~TRINITY_DN8466_c0_g1_i2.p1  ORF type:complete len:702 (-),score=68.99 TRINITY_DN8466_c0_g1_i2:558-2663(-)